MERKENLKIWFTIYLVKTARILSTSIHDGEIKDIISRELDQSANYLNSIAEEYEIEDIEVSSEEKQRFVDIEEITKKFI